MVEIKKYKKFKSKEVEEYLKGEWVREFSGIKNDREVRRRLRITSEAQDKRDFAMFSGFRLEPIAGTKNHWSIRTGSGAWRIFFVWEKNEAWEIDLNKHNYKKIRR
jgi:plasmid maintenance system killer protein